jgi:hypothetical protein
MQEETSFEDPLYSQKYPARRILSIALLLALFWWTHSFFIGKWGNVGAVILQSFVVGIVAVVLQSYDWRVRKRKGPRSKEVAQKQFKMAHWVILCLSLIILMCTAFALVFQQQRTREIFVIVFFGLWVASHVCTRIIFGSHRWYGLKKSRKEEYVALFATAVFSLIIVLIIALA